MSATAKKSPSGVLETDDAIILLLGAPGATERDQGRIEGITRLEKLLFLLEMETDAISWLKEKADFSPDNFGPFSSKAYQEIETLASYGLISDSATLSESAEDTWESEHIIGEAAAEPYATRNLALTPKGQLYYKKLLELLPSEAESVVSELKRRFGSIPLRRLIRYVYQRYPDFTEKSIIRDEILGS
ncbi:MAG TPA: hypothetical protein VLC07_04230 [Solirubrobacterales bacterium]|nr:hypothetical protein [Solirubrobacterales bacterium]